MYAAEQSMVFRVLILKQGVTLNRMWALVVHSLQAKLHFLHCECRDYLANQASNYPLVVQCRSAPYSVVDPGERLRGSAHRPPPPYFKTKLRSQRGKKFFFETALPLISRSRWLPPPPPPPPHLKVWIRHCYLEGSMYWKLTTHPSPCWSQHDK